MGDKTLIGRDEALGAIRGFLEAADRGSTALVLSGEAGIGKTVLWEQGLAIADRSCGWVLSCRGVEAEAALSFSGLSDLLSSVMPEELDTRARRRLSGLVALRTITNRYGRTYLLTRSARRGQLFRCIR
jgi:hypothetical protein